VGGLRQPLESQSLVERGLKEGVCSQGGRFGVGGRPRLRLRTEGADDIDQVG
jgi:hypothetical protein